MNVKLYVDNLLLAIGIAATDLRGGGGVHSNFLRRSFLNLTVNKN